MAVQIKTLEFFRLNIGGYFAGAAEISIKDDVISILEMDFPGMVPDEAEIQFLDKKQKASLIEILNQIFITKWKKQYVDEQILDGIQWEIEILYNNRKTAKKSYGSNAYPFVESVTPLRIGCKSLDQTPDFAKLLKLMNKLVHKKDLFY